MVHHEYEHNYDYDKNPFRSTEYGKAKKNKKRRRKLPNYIGNS
jgi:hypothetical protein